MPDRALDLVSETKVNTLIDGQGDARFEASGVVAVENDCYVIFDNRPDIGRIEASLTTAGKRNAVIAEHRHPGDYEDIAFDPVSQHFFLLIEAARRPDGDWWGKVREFDRDFHRLHSAWLKFPLPTANKGMEGLTCVRRDDALFMLALCEGNRCKAGAAGRRPGGGRIQVFARDDSRVWHRVATIRLPRTLDFQDHSGLAIRNHRICVLSQTASAIWIGRLSRTAWDIEDDGEVFRFPTGEDGTMIYCNVEGVSWLDDDRLVFVSDRMKRASQNARCAAKDQSIHIFRIPRDEAPLAAG